MHMYASVMRCSIHMQLCILDELIHHCEICTVIHIDSSLFILIFFFFNFGCVGSSLLRAGFLQLRQAGATLRCSVWASHCNGFSCCGARALGTWASVVVAHGLQSAGSVVVAPRLRCSVACGIFPDQGSNPCPLHWLADS